MRYILAGFCEYGNSVATMDEEGGSLTAEHARILNEAGGSGYAAFMENYDPKYDGTAAQAGFRTGDLIVGLEICEEIYLAEALVVEEESIIITEDEDGLRDLMGINSKKVVRRMVDIAGDTTDEQWVEWAQSCERLAPNSDTVLLVRRKASVEEGHEVKR